MHENYLALAAAVPPRPPPNRKSGFKERGVHFMNTSEELWIKTNALVLAVFDTG